jgi:hypothetical protein
MPHRDTIASILATGGDVPTKAAVAGVALLAANIWAAFSTLTFAFLLLAAVADFVTGVARAFREHGPSGWDDRKAANAGLKLAVAGVIVMVTVGIDTLVHETGKVDPETYAAFAAGCTIMTGIYLGSWIRNANYFFPGLGDALQKGLSKIGHEPPHNRRESDDHA